MKFTTLNHLAASVLAGMLLASRAWTAEPEAAIERVSKQNGQAVVLREGSTVPLDKDIALPNDIKVTTNGTFTVKGGKVRELKEGQILNADGTLINPDGSIMPVLDHLTMKNGRVVVVRDGESTPLSEEMTLSDGTRVRADGTVLSKDGRRRRLLDGQLQHLDGTPLPASDTVTLKGGKVMVQKDGSSLPIKAGQSITMSDGTKVHGNGTVVFKDGRRLALTEGQIIILEGVVSKQR